jgi:hypothetical protein
MNVPKPLKEHSINQDAVTTYIARLTEINPHLAEAVAKVVHATIIIHYEEFLDYLQDATDKFKTAMGDKPFTAVVTAMNKSDKWVTDIVQELYPGFVTTVKRVENVDGSEHHGNETDRNYVIFDDGSFSGIHMINTVEDLQQRLLGTDENYTIHVVTAITTSVAKENIAGTDTTRLETYHGACINRHELYYILTKPQLELIWNFYNLQESDNGLEDCFPVFFDHKMPGEYSGVPYIYAGLVPDTDEEYPLLTGCAQGLYLEYPPVPYRPAPVKCNDTTPTPKMVIPPHQNHVASEDVGASDVSTS